MEMKTYKHKTNGSTMTYKDGCMKVENLVIEGEPDLNYWEEVINKKIIFDTYCHGYYTQQPNGKWFYSTKEGFPLCDIEYTINESSIGEGRYLLETKAVEKDYEIISLKHKRSGRIYKYISGVHTHYTFGTTVKDDWEINSIKRLSDREVFSIGDIVKSKHWGDGQSSIIGGFGVVLGHFSILESAYTNDKSRWLSLDNVQHIKTSIFKSEDGVDIYEGDNLFLLSCTNWVISNVSPCQNFKSHPFKGVSDKEFKYFSTRENAEKYLKENKPKKLFTTEDGIDIFEDDNYQSVLINGFIFKGEFTAKYPNNGNFTSSACKTFSTKEAAEEYILMNKPCLSINDVMAELNKPQSNTYIIKNLKEKIKNV